MRFTLADKFIAWLTLLSGLSISTVAVWYSVAGLVSIFSASPIPIIVMGVTLEVSKLIATVWLKLNWERAPFFVKTYLMSAILVLMLITSMGIFGYLSKAHSDQNLVSGDVQAKLVLIDEKIKIERENIANAQTVIKQMDAAVSGVIATGDQEVKLRDGSTRINSAAERSLQIRRQQAKDRAALTKQIEEAQAKIVKLQEEAAPIRAENRKVEAEVGPIKYIAKLLYNDNPDANILEKAVTWVIIIIVSVFDPLAVVLLIASQYSFQWFRKQEDTNQWPDPWVADVGEPPTEEEQAEYTDTPPIESMTRDEWNKESVPHHPDTHPYLRKGFSYPEGWESVGPIVAKTEPTFQIFPELQDVKVEPEPILEKTKIEKFPTNPFVGEQVIITTEEDSKQAFVFNGKEWIESPLNGLSPLDQWNEMIKEAEAAVEAEQDTLEERVARGETYIDAQGQEIKLDVDLPKDESKKKSTYMIKENGEQKTKTKE